MHEDLSQDRIERFVVIDVPPSRGADCGETLIKKSMQQDLKQDLSKPESINFMNYLNQQRMLKKIQSIQRCITLVMKEIECKSVKNVPNEQNLKGSENNNNNVAIDGQNAQQN